MRDGVTLADRRASTCAQPRLRRDVAIDVNCVFEGESSSRRRQHRRELRAQECESRRRQPHRALLPPGRRRHRRALPHRPYARLRPAPRSRGSAHRNFVEVKASQIAARSKANHSLCSDTT